MAESLTRAIMRTMRCGSAVALIGMCGAFAETLPDPTQPPAVLGAASQTNDVAGTSSKGPVLQSVLIAPGRSLATINGQTIRLGEKFGEARLVKITESEVVLRNGKNIQTLKLFPNIEKHLIPIESATRPLTGRNKGK